MGNTSKKQPDPINVHVGARVRLRRRLLGLSQEKLGEVLGLTFQQVQKYEKGVNRIGASRLFKIAQALEVSTSYFFEGLPPGGKLRRSSEEAAAQFAIAEFINKREGLELNRAFTAIEDPRQRKAALDLIRALASCPAPLPRGALHERRGDPTPESGAPSASSRPAAGRPMGPDRSAA